MRGCRVYVAKPISELNCEERRAISPPLLLPFTRRSVWAMNWVKGAEFVGLRRPAAISLRGVFAAFWCIQFQSYRFFCNRNMLGPMLTRNKSIAYVQLWQCLIVRVIDQRGWSSRMDDSQWIFYWFGKTDERKILSCFDDHTGKRNLNEWMLNEMPSTSTWHMTARTRNSKRGVT